MPVELKLRIVVVGPHQQAWYRVQVGKDKLLTASRATDRELQFDFSARLGEPLADGRPRLLGPCVQGPPDARFVYVNTGTAAGQPDTCWTRRAKVPLAGITSTLVKKLGKQPTAVLEARIGGLAKDGGPACASVPLLAPGWQIAD